jgi:leader peptidase (prepilin peptidase) / N-methyltransferase
VSLVGELFRPLVVIFSEVDAISCVLMFCFGSLIGSFLNVCIGRLPTGKSIVAPGSACVHCGTPIPPWLNLPLLSYAVVGGACSRCASPLSLRYVGLEALCGALAVALFAHVGSCCPLFFVWALLACFLVVVFFIDLDTWLILDEVSYLGMLAGLLLRVAVPLEPTLVSLLSPFTELLGHPLGGWLEAGLERLMRWQVFHPQLGSLLEALAGLLVCGAFYKAVSVLGALVAKQEALGQGDVKFAALLGAFLGPLQGFLTLMLAFPLGLLVLAPVLLLRGYRSKTPFPFGTFMSLSALLVVLYGDKILALLTHDGR